ncbi:Dam family site-specific DNA-(adenine-N6)-methyltransferase [uncultured Thomasclavelia sp.]|uniref:DNA adenine methylase n=1 Tax=uncultured Thomasclavelia sp. TaxID=3025759 RepID=UPI00280C0A35|nr:Dam family site-specific DNA-(adenine-N6)-methyltransferase [uncultured Thomasclavelia sp.]
MSNTFLKWAGGKKWLVNNESYRFPKEFNRYIEPFLGGGSVFFYLEPQNALLSDINQELIDTFIAVRDELNGVLRNLNIHSRNHSKDYYYKMRNRRTRKSITSAARMIYLNRACYNGIYRVNSQGGFNVPIGTTEKIIFNKEEFEKSSNALKNAEIVCQDFQKTIDLAEQGDFLFCDPPYAVINEDERFVKYTADAFTWEDQIRLSKALNRAKKRGVKIIMTNISHPAVKELYENLNGFILETVERKCTISGTLNGRKKYKELIVSANINNN